MAKQPRKPLVETVMICRRPDQTYRSGVPDAVHTLIGRAVVLWSNVEQVVEELTWAFLRVDVEEGRIITASLDFNHKLMLLRKLAQHHADADTLPRLLDAAVKISDLYSIRNIIVHGTWVTILPDNTVGVLSLKDKLPDGTAPNQIMCTEMPIENMLVFIGNLITAHDFLVDVRQKLQRIAR
jgi:hypothetical protein